MSFTNAEVSKLRQLLSTVSLAPKTKSKRNRKRARGPQQPAHIPAGYSSIPNASNPRRRKSGLAATNNSGDVVVSRSELLSPLIVVANSNSLDTYVDMFPTSSVLAWLAKLTIAFERITWLSARVMYKPFSGTTKTGSVCIGVDWNSSLTKDLPASRSKTQSTTPVMEMPIWQSGSMMLPAMRLMSRREYTLSAGEPFDRQPCQILISVTSQPDRTDVTVGELWVDYKVRLSGTTS